MRRNQPPNLKITKSRNNRVLPSQRGSRPHSQMNSTKNNESHASENISKKGEKSSELIQVVDLRDEESPEEANLLNSHIDNLVFKDNNYTSVLQSDIFRIFEVITHQF